MCIRSFLNWPASTPSPWCSHALSLLTFAELCLCGYACEASSLTHRLLRWGPVAEHVLGFAHHLLISIEVKDSFVSRMLGLPLAVCRNPFGGNPIAEKILPVTHGFLPAEVADALVSLFAWLHPANPCKSPYLHLQSCHPPTSHVGRGR